MKRTITTITLLIILLSCLTDGASAIVGLRGATWGEIRYLIPRDDGDEDNLLLDGWIRQGVDLAKWNNTTLNAYGTLRYRLDTEKTDWYNSLGPGGRRRPRDLQREGARREHRGRVHLGALLRDGREQREGRRLRQLVRLVGSDEAVRGEIVNNTRVTYPSIDGALFNCSAYPWHLFLNERQRIREPGR